MESAITYYDHLEYFTTIWNNFCPSDIVCDHLVYFSVLVSLDQGKSGNPAFEARNYFSPVVLVQAVKG
jgi:hypothetical protein